LALGQTLRISVRGKEGQASQPTFNLFSGVLSFSEILVELAIY